MHETISKRIFVGGLASEVTAGEITERFSRFGKVGNLSLKSRRDESGNVIKSFAHLDLEGDEANIKKCFNTYQNTKWKGSVLQLQYAKESFLQKLEKEREEAHNQQDDDDVLVVKPSQTSQPQIFEVKGPAVPGTPVPGKKDWVVGKYGRVLPILKLKKSYKIRMVKHDPSKHCHAAKVFKDDTASTPTDTSCSRLTWEINTPDTEITKKRKGEFPQTCSSVKKIKQPVLTPSEYFKKIQITRKMEEVEVVKLGSGNVTAATKLIKSNRFDSDLESDSEGNSFDQNVFNMPQTGIINQLHEPTAGSKTVKENKENLTMKASETRDNKNTVSQSTGRELPVSASVSKNEPVILGPKLANGAEISKSPGVKQKENIASAFNKISKFKGLGMLGLLDDCSRTCPEKLEQTTNSSLSVYSTDVIMTSDAVDGIVSNELRDRKNDENRKKIAAVSTIEVRNETLVRNKSQIKDPCDEDSMDRSFDFKKVFSVSEDNDEEEQNSAVEEENDNGEEGSDDEEEENGAVEEQNDDKEEADSEEEGSGDEEEENSTVEEENDDKEEADSEEEGSDDEEEENGGVEEQNDDKEEADSEEEGSGDEEEENSTVEEENVDVEEENSAVEEENDDNKEEDSEKEGSDDGEEENSSVEEEDNGNEEEGSDDEEVEDGDNEDSDDEEVEGSDDEEKENDESHEDFKEKHKPSAGIDKKLGNTNGSLKVTHTLVGKTSFTSASEKFKNSKVPIIDMNALRFDPTKIQKPEAFTVLNTALSRQEGATATSRHTNRNKEAIKNERKHEGFQQSKLLPKYVRGQIKR